MLRVLALAALPLAYGFGSHMVDPCSVIEDNETGFRDLELPGFTSCAVYKASGNCNEQNPTGLVGTYFCVKTCGTTIDQPNFNAEEICVDRSLDHDEFVKFVYNDYFSFDNVISCDTHNDVSGQYAPENDLCNFPSFAYICPVHCKPVLDAFTP
ncbi:hypothetical protein M885DRAFT_528946 [Pelagophyceae sp. CCMP2097]|nr:hypothetical protein M885DRAFT_528946 [Pelagophyceae sp. CCMP2097]